MKVHPHRCGETQGFTQPGFMPGGSPPQVWGNPTCNHLALARARFTPTGVGKPWRRVIAFGIDQVHPHRCGETFDGDASRIRDQGSPPQVWGNHLCNHAPYAKYGFTPTGVGKPVRNWTRDHGFEVHPHRCGETIATAAMPHLTNGSPPQVWGNPGWLTLAQKTHRFTPTGVGKPFSVRHCDGSAEVHPHRCGETIATHPADRPHRGSPPQVWGNQFELKTRKEWKRFTPTGVGKPVDRFVRLTAREVHPHRCGETTNWYVKHSKGHGSPPQVWGNPQATSNQTGTTRFTPTGVGKPTPNFNVGQAP